MVKVKGTAKGRDLEFETGTNISVTEGHLYVYSGTSTIAIFAPETWRDAVTEQRRAN